MAMRDQLFWRLSWLCLCLSPIHSQPQVPIYLPGYNEKSWSNLQGSIVAQNDKETTYTIFCKPQTPPSCDLEAGAPFVITEGPSTLIYHATIEATYIGNFECDLKGTTIATCSGYSSYDSGYNDGSVTGPTEITWKSTYEGSKVEEEWATLTLADVPATTETLDLTVETGDGEPGDSTMSRSTDTIFPQETQPGGGCQAQNRWLAFAALGSIIFALQHYF